MNKQIDIFLKDSEAYIKVDAGSTAIDIFEASKQKVKSRPMNVKINHATYPLTHPIYCNCQVEFVYYNEESGYRTYLRTLIAIMAKAARELKCSTRGKDITVEYAVSKGYYCTWSNPKCTTAPSKEEIAQLSEKMREIIAKKIEIKTRHLPTEKAIELLSEKGMMHTAQLLRTSGKCYVRCIDIEGYIDYMLGSLLPNTGDVWNFALDAYEGGILLRLPKRTNPDEIEPMLEQKKLFMAFSQHLALQKILAVDDVCLLNEKLRKRDSAAELIRVAEAMQEKQIAAIAEEIKRRHAEEGVRIVLLAGPSSSGKTTTSKRLRTQLITNFLTPYTLSLDDYFVPREFSPRDENGNYDFECLHALDLPYLNDSLNQIISGKKVEIPNYDFATGTRMFKGNELQLGADAILIIEGIHALNPELTAHIEKNKLFRIYVSALTTVSLDAHNFISTSDNRLIRRIIRDAKYRNHSAVRTISMWPSVRRGENKWIFPYQENADVMFNSAMLYELAALRPLAEPILRQVNEIEAEYSEAQRLLHLLSHIEPITPRYLPPTSLLREFIGGSSFIY